eukprot:m51a1_g14831 hypothetical protein (658) ;mRNA; r:689112-692071
MPHVVLACVGVYANAIEGEFTFDDWAAVQRHVHVNPASDVWGVWRTDFWGTDIKHPGSHKSFRPITTLTFRWNRLLAEGWNANYTTDREPFFTQAPDSDAPCFKAVNVALHCCTSALVLALALALRPGDLLGATLAGLTFAVHPVHTENVDGAVGRADILCAAFSLLSLWAYSRSAQLRSTRWLYLAAAIAFGWLAALSKEVGLVVGAVLVFYDLVVPPPVLARYTDVFRGRSLGHLAARVAVVALSTVASLVYRKVITVSFSVSHGIRHIENPYMQLLVYPVSLSADWSYNCLPLVQSVYDVRVLWTVLMYVAVAAIVLGFLWNIESGRYYLVALGWLFATFFPSSNVLFFVGTMIGERLLYVPSVGFCVFFGLCLSSLWSRLPNRTLRLLLLSLPVVLLAMYSAKTVARNPQWVDNASLFRSAVNVCPESAKAHLMLGQEMQEMGGMWELTVDHFEKALSIEPQFCEAEYSLGISYLHVNRTHPGIELVQRSIDCNTTLKEAVNSLHVILSGLLEQHPEEPSILVAWGNVLIKLDRKKEAADYYMMAARLHSTKKNIQEAVSAALVAYETFQSCEIAYWSGIVLSDSGLSINAVPLLLSASYKHNCTSTYTMALDRLVGIYSSTGWSNDSQHTQDWTDIVIRGREALADLTRPRN